MPVRIAAVQDQGVHTMVRLEVGPQSQTRSIAWAKLRDPGAAPASGTAFASLPPARCALYADERRVP